MALLRAVAEMMSQNQVVAGVIEEIITVNEVFQLLPFVGISGKAYLYHREKTLPTVSFLEVGGDVPENTGEFAEVITKLRILIGDIDVDNFLRETMSDSEDQLALQLAMKAKAMGRTFMEAMAVASNTATPTSFDGMRALMTNADSNAAMSVAGSGAITYGILDQLVDMVPNKPDFLMMRSGTRRAYVALLRASGGTQPAMIEVKNFGAPVLAHNGVPILINDFLPVNETAAGGVSGGACTSIYAVRANEVDGLHGLYGGAEAGIRMETVGTVQTKDAIRTRLKWYCGMALKSTKSMARAFNITNI
jgi:hypothetical protein